MTINQHSLQQQVVDDLAKDMSKSMDFEVLCDVLSRFGWTVLKIEYDPDSGQAWNTVMNWAGDNFEDEFQEHAGTWLIESAKDATMFALKWKTK
jgi:hypothetical protein